MNQEFQDSIYFVTCTCIIVPFRDTEREGERKEKGRERQRERGGEGGRKPQQKW